MSSPSRVASVALAFLSTTALAQAQPAEPTDPPTATVEVKDGVTVAAGDQKTTINVRVQTRYEYLSTDEGDGLDRGEETAFQIARARVGLKGSVLDPRLSYKFQADFGKGFVTLKDFYSDWALADGVVVRAGQWKRPFSRQQINSSGDLELVDRAITDRAFLGSRDIGVALHNDYEKSPELEWAIGVFNGTGDAPAFAGEADPMTGEVSGKFSNVPAVFGPALVARVGINRGGIKGYKEADLEGGPLRFAIAASTLAELDVDDDGASATRHQLDGVVKVAGLSASAAVYLSTAQDGAGFADQRRDAVGLHVQVGTMLSDVLQPALRYALVDPRGGSNTLHEITAGLSLFQLGHSFKWQTDVSWLGSGAGDARADDVRLRTQLQLAF
jgi:hypothetical protein